MNIDNRYVKLVTNNISVVSDKRRRGIFWWIGVLVWVFIIYVALR